MKKKVKNNVNRKKLVIAIISIIAIIYIIYVAILLVGNKKDTIFVEQGTIHKEETVVGYIIRNESVIKSEEYQSEILQIAGEGERVSKNEAIFQYNNNEIKELINKIQEVDFKIQEMLKKEKITLTSDIKLVEKQIDDKLEDLRKLNNIQEISEYSKTIKNLLEKKIDALGQITTSSSELKKIVKERKNYKEQISNSTEYIVAPTSGMVSYRVDGLEEKLRTDNFHELKKEYLDGLNIKTGQIIATSVETGKIIDNFKYYIAVPMESKEAMSAEVGNEVKIRLWTNEEINAKITYINEEENKRVVIFEIDRKAENMVNHRKISFDVIWSSYSGLKVSNKAIVQDENNLSYVVRTRSGYLTKLLIKIVSSNENYAIVKTYSSEELANMGYSEEDIETYKKIKLYDEILLYPQIEKIK